MRANVLPTLARGIPSDQCWYRSGKEVNRITLTRDGLALKTFRQIDRGVETILERHTISLTATVCHLAGKRLWFRCPNCDRRTGSIFLVERPFGRRVCLQLRYESQRDNLPGGGILTRAVRNSNQRAEAE